MQIRYRQNTKKIEIEKPKKKKPFYPLFKKDQIKNSLYYALIYAYPASGFDPVLNKLNGQHINNDDLAYLSNPRTIITSMLGIPNRRLNGRSGFMWRDILLNYIGWERNVSTPKKVFNFIFGVFPLPIVPVYNIFKTGVTLVRNVLATFTEFAPSFLKLITSKAIKNMDEKSWKNLSNGLSEPELGKTQFRSPENSHGLYLFLKGIRGFSRLWNFVGSAITSPTNNIRQYWNSARSTRYLSEYGKMILSGVISTVFLGLTLKYAVPYAAANAPAWVASLPLPTWLTTAGKAAVDFLTPAASFLTKFVSVYGNFNSAYLMLLTGLGLGRLNHAMTNGWRKPAPAKIDLDLSQIDPSDLEQKNDKTTYNGSTKTIFKAPQPVVQNDLQFKPIEIHEQPAKKVYDAKDVVIVNENSKASSPKPEPKVQKRVGSDSSLFNQPVVKEKTDETKKEESTKKVRFTSVTNSK